MPQLHPTRAHRQQERPGKGAPFGSSGSYDGHTAWGRRGHGVRARAYPPSAGKKSVLVNVSRVHHGKRLRALPPGPGSNSRKAVPRAPWGRGWQWGAEHARDRPSWGHPHAEATPSCPESPGHAPTPQPVGPCCGLAGATPPGRGLPGPGLEGGRQRSPRVSAARRSAARGGLPAPAPAPAGPASAPPTRGKSSSRGAACVPRAAARWGGCPAPEPSGLSRAVPPLTAGGRAPRGLLCLLPSGLTGSRALAAGGGRPVCALG